MGQAMTTTQFFLYGRRHFTRTGWERASKKYIPDFLENMSLADKTFVVTGANSGIGKMVTEYMASKGGKVYMVCRNKERGEQARQELSEKTGNDELELMIADVSLKADVRRLAHEFETKVGKLDALVCNAGALSSEKTLTSEGVETTMAAHLICGSYLLTELLMPSLKKSADPRVILVSSGGMYNTRFPKHETALATREDKKFEFSGQMAYAYAKRGQVLLCEEWTKRHKDTNVKFVSCHPGWVDTPGVASAYGDQAKYLQPMRDLWQGSEGICWLGVVDGSELEGGAYYLDRTPQVKHIAGAFMTEGSRTKNSPEQVDALMEMLEEQSA